MMCKLKGWMDKGEHYDVEMKGWRNCDIMMCKLKGDGKRGHYDVQNKRVDGKGGHMIAN